MVGGFGLCGIQENAISRYGSLKVYQRPDLYFQQCRVDNFGLGLLLPEQADKEMVSSYVGENEGERQMLSGGLEVGSYSPGLPGRALQSRRSRYPWISSRLAPKSRK